MALEALGGVTVAEVSHEKGTAIVSMTENVDNAAITAAVTDAGYAVLGIE